MMRPVFFPLLFLLAACATQPPVADGGAELATSDNITPLFASARIERAEANGQIIGLRLADIEPDSNWCASCYACDLHRKAPTTSRFDPTDPLDRDGFLKNDVVTAVNGRALRSREDFIRLFMAMVQPAVSEVQVLRPANDSAPEHVEILRVRSAR